MRVVGQRNEVLCREDDSQRGELEDHLEALSRLVERPPQDEDKPLICTLLLRSAKSLPALALTEMRDVLADAGILAKVILSTVEPDQELHSLLLALAALLPDGNLNAHVRWARKPQLLDAHEQAVYGREMCWTGDAVRRGANRRNRLAFFEDTPEALLHGSRAFEALWAASDLVPIHLLDIHAAERGVAADTSPGDASLAVASRSVEGWPLLRN